MPSVEKSLVEILTELRRVAGLPVIAGASGPPSAEWSLQNIYEVVANWSPSAGGFDPSAIGEDLLPDTDATYNVGSEVLRWANGVFSTSFMVGVPAGEPLFSISPTLLQGQLGTAQINLSPTQLQFTDSVADIELIIDGLSKSIVINDNISGVPIPRLNISPDSVSLRDPAGEPTVEFFSGQLTLGDGTTADRVNLNFGGLILASADVVQITEYTIDYISIQDAAGLPRFQYVNDNLKLGDADLDDRVGLSFSQLKFRNAIGEDDAIFDSAGSLVFRDNPNQITRVELDKNSGLRFKNAADDNLSEYRPTQIILRDNLNVILADISALDGTLSVTLTGLTATDPVAAGQLFTMDSAGIAAALAAGARYVLISDGP